VIENRILTAEGPIEPAELGATLAHEHVFIDQVTSWFDPLDRPREQRLAEEPVTIGNLGYVRTNPLKNKDNMRLDSAATAIDELSKYQHAGGEAVVDLTPKGIGADPEHVRRVGRAADLDVIHGTAFYTRTTHPDRVETANREEITSEFVDDVHNGIASTDVRAGIIGEIGLSGSIYTQEEKVLRAGARAALQTGAPLNIHPPLFGPDPTPVGALRALDILEEEGLPLKRVVVSHMDQDHAAMQDLDDHREIADRGAYVEFDQWHAWTGYLDGKGKAYPSDATRVDAVVDLVESGYLDRVLFGHDVCTKMQLTTYGGKGYVYLHDVVLPWLRSRGLSQDQCRSIMIENPWAALAFAAPT
jgi:phosphotriesterase-related protein